MPVDEETMKRRYREFMDLLPLTMEIAGLPKSAGSYNFTVDQMEVRLSTLAAAHKLAKQLVRDVIST